MISWKLQYKNKIIPIVARDPSPKIQPGITGNRRILNKQKEYFNVLVLRRFLLGPFFEFRPGIPGRCQAELKLWISLESQDEVFAQWLEQNFSGMLGGIVGLRSLLATIVTL
eukprot:scaffold62365_cov44-Cyclotella_meneghiniana.AAC.3